MAIWSGKPVVLIYKTRTNHFLEIMTECAGNRYHFNCSGTVKDILYPNKAILSFKLNGKDEKAILLSKMLTVDGKAVEESSKQLMSELLKPGDLIEFDCHIYDKGGVGSGKDKCNFFAMRASKSSPDKNTVSFTLPPSVKFCTGWVSELYTRKGVLTFHSDQSDTDERVLFLASKVYFFEKRLGSRQPLTDLLREGDSLQFEAVSQDLSEESQYCTWFAHLVWKGKRPSIDPANYDHGSQNGGQLLSSRSSSRRDSCDSSSSSDYNGGGGDDTLFLIMPNSNGKMNGVVRGVGMVARIIDEKSGILWWVKKNNHFESVWFQADKTFYYGTNLTSKNLQELLHEDDPVNFLAEKASCDSPTKWVAKQVFVNDETSHRLQKALEKD